MRHHAGEDMSQCHRQGYLATRHPAARLANAQRSEGVAVIHAALAFGPQNLVRQGAQQRGEYRTLRRWWHFLHARLGHLPPRLLQTYVAGQRTSRERGLPRSDGWRAPGLARTCRDHVSPFPASAGPRRKDRCSGRLGTHQYPRFNHGDRHSGHGSAYPVNAVHPRAADEPTYGGHDPGHTRSNFTACTECHRSMSRYY